jgi:hypothetical protein
MSWTTTLMFAAVVLAVVVACGWRGAQAPDLRRGPRLFPYRLVMVLGAALLFALIVHMAGLAGVGAPERPF